MTKGSARPGAALSAAVALCLGGPGALAADRAETGASVTVVQPAAVTVVNTVVNNAPLQAILATVAVAPAGVVFTAPGAPGGSVSGGGPAAGIGGAGVAVTEAAAPAGLVAFAGPLAGTTIAGDAVSVSVGDLSGGSATGSARVPVVIAHYN